MRTKLVLSLMVALLVTGAAAKAKDYRVSGAIVHIRQEEFLPAIDLLQAVISDNPNDAEAYSYLGYALAKLNRFKEAADAWSRAEAILEPQGKKKEKDLKKIKTDRMFFWDKSLQAGGAALNRALTYGDPGFVANTGETKEGDFDKAAHGFVDTQYVFGGHPKTTYYLGRTYEIMAAYYAGKTDAGETIKFNDYDLATAAVTPRELPRMEYVKLLQTKSLEAYKKAVEIKRADMAAENFDESTPLAEYVRSVAGMSAQLGENEQALQMIDSLLAESGDDIDLLSAKAEILEKMDPPQYEGTLAIYEKILGLTTSEGKKGQLYGLIGALYYNKENKSRDPKKALENLLKAEELCPRVMVYMNLGLAYAELGEYDKAQAYYKKGEDVNTALDARKTEGAVVKAGDAKDLVYGIWGAPETIKSNPDGTSEWVYSETKSASFDKDGKVTSFKG